MGPAQFPVPILIVQHISSGFVDGLAAWLNTVCSLNVKVARNGDPLTGSTVYLAGDDAHLGVGADFKIKLNHAGPIGGFRPSATHLFKSVATVFGSSSVALLLTGMGEDGVDGLRAVRSAGGGVLAQDEASSIVFGINEFKPSYSTRPPQGAAAQWKTAGRMSELSPSTAAPKELPDVQAHVRNTNHHVHVSAISAPIDDTIKTVMTRPLIMPPRASVGVSSGAIGAFLQVGEQKSEWPTMWGPALLTGAQSTGK